jgi:hypothetical protein
MASELKLSNTIFCKNFAINSNSNTQLLDVKVAEARVEKINISNMIEADREASIILKMDEVNSILGTFLIPSKAGKVSTVPAVELCSLLSISQIDQAGNSFINLPLLASLHIQFSGGETHDYNVTILGAYYD